MLKSYIKSDAAGWWCDPYWGAIWWETLVLQSVRLHRRRDDTVLAQTS